MKKQLLFLFAALLPMLASAQTKVYIDGIRYNLYKETKQAEVILRSNNYIGSITIPTMVTYGGVEYSVTSIGDGAFFYCSGLTTITIPESVTNIGDDAFNGCTSLTAITLPEGVTSIGNSAFRYCSSLTAITIPEGVTSIGGSAFYECSRLTSITIPEGVTSIGDYAFIGCSSLTAITIPEGVTSIGSSAFSHCSRLTSITIPEGVTSIENHAFYACSSLASITIPEAVTSIGSYAFHECTSLTSITIPKGVTNIEYEAFDGCSSLSDVYCYAEATPSTGSNTFEKSNIKNATLHVPASALNAYVDTEPWSSFGTIVVIKDANTKVEIDGIWYNLVPKAKQAEVIFKGISYDEYWDEYSGSITIPATVTYEGVRYSVTSIGPQAFSHCSSLTAVSIPEGMTNIGDGAFSYCSSLTSITIPEGVTSIGEYAFDGCSSLTAITIPEGVTSIGDYAFRDCSSLTAVSIPEGVTSIAGGAFRDCSSLTAITLPEGVTSIEIGAFYGCSSLTSITLPESVTSIESGAFKYCCNLTAINIPEGVTSIGGGAFSYCSSLTSITLPEGVTSIESGAFYCCTSLTSITLPESVASIGGTAFAYCRSLTAITLPEGVMSIGWYAFDGCTSLTAITFPEDVTSIGDGAFNCCSSLTSINIPESVTSIGESVFCDCSSLINIVLPKSLKSIGSQAFANCSELLYVYCNAEVVPWADADAFDGSYPECITLHVPASALNAYRSKAPWSSFGTIKSATNEPVQSITLSQQSATMTEGTTLTLTATIAPIYATDRSLTWSSSNASVATVNDGKVTAIKPGTAIITATANDGSGVNAQCDVTVEATPTYVTITINQYGSGTYCSEHALDFSQVERLKAYAATGYNYSSKVVTLVRIYTSQPRMGIFVKGEPGTTYEVPVMEISTDNTYNMLAAVLAQTSVDAYSADGLYANYKYTIKNGENDPKFYQFANGSTMGAGKAYLQIPTAWLPAGETRSIGLRFDEGEGTTDIENSQFTIDNSQLTYDLFGRRVDNPVKGGIYIVGGKKVVVK